MNNKKVKLFIGVDAGSTGAIATLLINPIPMLPEINIHTMPGSAKEIRDLLNRVGNLNEVTKVICEKVHSSPQMGVSTAFKFGENFGILEGILTCFDTEFVTPQAWQAALNCRTAGDKHISLQKAKELFPDTKGITLKTADALLIAYYGYKKYFTED